MKKCKNCNNQIDDKYILCLDCNTKSKEQKPNGNDAEIMKVLTQINWNLGAMAKQQRLYYLFKMSTEKSGSNEMQEKIYNLFMQDLEKDLKQLKAINEERRK